MNYIMILNALRSLGYGWIAVEAFILAFIYYFGYQRIKPTSIIRAIVFFFTALGLFFVFTTYNTASDLFDSPMHETIKLFGVLFLTPLALSLHNFRKITLDDTSSMSQQITKNTEDTKANTKDIKINTERIDELEKTI